MCKMTCLFVFGVCFNRQVCQFLKRGANLHAKDQDGQVRVISLHKHYLMEYTNDFFLMKTNLITTKLHSICHFKIAEFAAMHDGDSF